MVRNRLIKWIILLLNSSQIKIILSIKYPIITEHPRDNQIVQDTASIELYCSADGNPRPKITWYKNNKILTDNDVAGSAFVDEQPGHGSLTFLSASAGNTRNGNTDNGNYWCRAQNQFGYVDSKNATLTVAYLEDKFQLSPKAKYSVEINQKIKLDCNPPKGNPDPVVTWYFNGNPIMDKIGEQKRQEINIDTHGNLNIYNVNSRNAGSYQCIASMKDVPELKRYSRMTELEVLGK